MACCDILPARPSTTHSNNKNTKKGSLLDGNHPQPQKKARKAKTTWLTVEEAIINQCAPGSETCWQHVRKLEATFSLTALLCLRWASRAWIIAWELESRTMCIGQMCPCLGCSHSVWPPMVSHPQIASKHATNTLPYHLPLPPSCSTALWGVWQRVEGCQCHA